MQNILVSDIGGSNCRFFLVQTDPKNPLEYKTLHTTTYPTASASSLDEAISTYFELIEKEFEKPLYCVIAIAGAPKNNNIIKMANIAWKPIYGHEIAVKFGFKDCKLLNDFEAVGYASVTLNYSKFIRLQRAKGKKARKMVIAGLGTGLGVCSIFSLENSAKVKICGTESGHLPLGAVTEEEFEYEEFVRENVGVEDFNYVGQEYLFSGRGIPLLYKFLYKRYRQESYTEHLTGKDVMNKLKDDDELRPIFLRWFCKIVGRSLSNLIKIFLPKGGRVLLGGLIYKVFQYFYKGNGQTFLSAIKEYWYTEEPFFDAYDSVSLYLYSNENDVFAVEGAINYVLLTYFGSALTGQLEERRIELDKYLQEIKPDIPLTYYSAKLKEKFLTLKGFVESSKIYNLFLAKVTSDFTIVEAKVDRARRLYKSYAIETFDTCLTLLKPLDSSNYYPNDILKISGNTMVYYTEDKGWYLVPKSNSLINIEVKTFNELNEAFSGLADKPEAKSVLGGLEAKYIPKSIIEPKEKVDKLNWLYYCNYKQRIQSKFIYMKAKETNIKKIFRKEKFIEIELKKCKIWTENFGFDVWTPSDWPVPQLAFYGFVVLHLLHEPGFTPRYLLLLNENTIYNKSNDYDTYINCDNDFIAIEDIVKDQFAEYIK